MDFGSLRLSRTEAQSVSFVGILDNNGSPANVGSGWKHCVPLPRSSRDPGYRRRGIGREAQRGARARLAREHVEREAAARSACRTQLQIARAEHSHSRDSSSAVRPLRSNSTICRRYSGAYGLVVIGTPPDHSLRVSTKAGQLQSRGLIRESLTDPLPWWILVQ